MPKNWHCDLVETLVASNPDAATLAMGRHIRTGMEEIQDRITAPFGSNLGDVSQRSGNGDGEEILVGGHWRTRYTRSNAAS